MHKDARDADTERHGQKADVYYTRGILEKLVAKFGMKDSKEVITPLAAHFRLSIDRCPKTQEERSYMDRVPYSNATGSLMYAMVCTRPDLAYATSLVSRFMAKPGKAHWEAVNWILRYLKGTETKGLVYGKKSGNKPRTGRIFGCRLFW